ncbi:hypothetical protein Taro_019477, partial [Colocasia esculenta]|nr:hypothetical protein [Colocasia esculenta]
MQLGASFDSDIEKPCMLLLDSLLSIGARSLEVHIISFVMDIYKAIGREVDKDIIAQIPLHVPKVPQQKNGEECGIFILYFIHLFMRDAPKSECSKGYLDF